MVYINQIFILFLPKEIRMTYTNCIYTAQGKLECKQKNNSLYVNEDGLQVIEGFIETKTKGKTVDNIGMSVSFTERPTSKMIWDKKSAEVICTPLCAKYQQEWTKGFRSIGGSVCYCQDIPTQNA